MNRSALGLLTLALQLDRQLERQIHTQLFARLLKRRDKAAVMELARRGQRPVWRRTSSTPSASLSTNALLLRCSGSSNDP